MSVISSLRTRVGKNILTLSMLQGFNYLMALATVPYLARVLGPGNYGRMAFALAFMQYFVVVVDYGFNLSATRSIAISKAATLDLSRQFSAVILIKLSLAIVGFGLVLALVNFVPIFSREHVLFLSAYVLVIGNALFPVWLFQGLEKMWFIAVLTILGRAAAVAAIFFLVKERTEYALAAALQASTYLVAGVLAIPFIYLNLQVKLIWPGARAICAALADGWHVFISTASVSLYTNGSVFVLGLVASPVVVGYFAGAQRIMWAAQQLITPISQAVFPHVAALAAVSRKRALRFLTRLLRRQALVTAGLSLIIIGFAPWIVPAILGAEYKPSVELVSIMSFLPFIIGLSNVFGIQIMLNFGMKRVFSRILLSSGVLNVFLVLALGAWRGAVGAAISVLLTEICITGCMAFVLWRKQLIKTVIMGGA